LGASCPKNAAGMRISASNRGARPLPAVVLMRFGSPDVGKAVGIQIFFAARIASASCAARSRDMCMKISFFAT